MQTQKNFACTVKAVAHYVWRDNFITHTGEPHQVQWRIFFNTGGFPLFYWPKNPGFLHDFL